VMVFAPLVFAQLALFPSFFHGDASHFVANYGKSRPHWQVSIL
jgi:hypothetical protein